jgi:hypothetical protein
MRSLGDPSRSLRRLRDRMDIGTRFSRARLRCGQHLRIYARLERTPRTLIICKKGDPMMGGPRKLEAQRYESCEATNRFSARWGCCFAGP